MHRVWTVLRELSLIAGGMDEIRTNMGVCPQFDILWQELTAREHMILFGNIKGLATSSLVADEADKLLREVCAHAA